MRRKTDFFEIQVPYKFETIEECDKKISALIEYIRYHAKKNGYFCQGIIVASETDTDNLLSVKKEQISKKGRPRVLKVINDYEVGQLETDKSGQYHFIKKEDSEIKEVKVLPHIHMFFLLNPGATFAEIIRLYVQKNWAKDSSDEFRNEKVYKKNEDINMSYTNYLINQASTIRFINENHSEELKDFPSERYNFRTYYKAYLDKESSMHNHRFADDKEGFEKSVLKYNEISKFYNNVRKYNDISGYEEK